MKDKNNSSVFFDLIFSIIIPAFILTKGKNYLTMLTPVELFIFALSFPILYGLYDFISSKNFNVISLAGFFNVMLTGGVGLLEATKPIIILKETGFPFVLGVLLLVFNHKVFNFIKEHADEMLDVKKIKEHTTSIFYNSWLNKISKRVIYPFFLSALLNGIITYIIIQSAPGTQAFNEEIAQLLLWGFLGVALPCLIVTMVVLIISFKELEKETTLSFNELFREMK